MIVNLNGAPVGDASYWIIALGPIVDGQYDWAIVSDKNRLTLFVLTRDVAKFESTYDASVKTLLRKQLGTFRIFYPYSL